MGELKYIGTLPNGQTVYDRADSHWQTAHKVVSAELLREALQKIDLSGEIGDRHLIIQAVRLGRVLGKNNCVSVNSKDKCFRARRYGRETLTHIVIDREPEDCDKVAVILEKCDGYYKLVTTYIGEIAPMEPDDPVLLKENNPIKIAEAKKFWDSHALVYDSSAIDYIVLEDGSRMEKDEFERKYLNKTKPRMDFPDGAVLMLMGGVASGKTMKAKELAKQYNIDIFSSDDIRIEMFAKEIEKGNIDKVYSKKSKTAVYDKIVSLVEKNMQDGKRSIVDATFLFEMGENARKRIYELSQKYNRQVRVIIHRVPLDMARTFNFQRERKEPEEIVDKMWYEFERTYPRIIEELENLLNAKYAIIDSRRKSEKLREDEPDISD